MGFIQIPKDEILISLKKKLNQTRLIKTKDIQRLDGQERKDPLDNCPTFKARSRWILSHAALTISLVWHRWKYSTYHLCSGQEICVFAFLEISGTRDKD